MTTLSTVPICTPVISSEHPWIQIPALYLTPFSDKRASLIHPVEKIGASKGVLEIREKSSRLSAALKIISYILTLGIFPLLAFIALVVIRCVHKFHWVQVPSSPAFPDVLGENLSSTEIEANMKARLAAVAAECERKKAQIEQNRQQLNDQYSRQLAEQSKQASTMRANLAAVAQAHQSVQDAFQENFSVCVKAVYAELDRDPEFQSKCKELSDKYKALHRQMPELAQVMGEGTRRDHETFVNTRALVKMDRENKSVTNPHLSLQEIASRRAQFIKGKAEFFMGLLEIQKKHSKHEDATRAANAHIVLLQGLINKYTVA
jgi:hypothetical protein